MKGRQEYILVLHPLSPYNQNDVLLVTSEFICRAAHGVTKLLKQEVLFVRFVKSLKLTRSLLVLFICVGLLSMTIQTLVMEKLNKDSLYQFQEALLESRIIKINSFAQVVNSDLFAFRSQLNAIYSGNEFRRLKIRIDEGLISSRYLQDCQYMWSELKMRLFDNSMIDDISLYMADSGRKVTTGSVVRISDSERTMLDVIVACSNGIELIDRTLYLWVPQFYSRNKSVEDMGSIAVGRITEQTIRRYLSQFSTDISGANLMLLYLDEGGVTLLSQLGNHPNTTALLEKADINTQKMNGYAMMTEAGKEQLLTWTQVGNLPIVFCELTPSGTLQGKMSQYNVQLAISRILVLLVTMLLMIFLYSIVRQPLRKLRMALRAVEKGDLNKRLPKTIISDFQYVNDQFNAMGMRLQNLVEREYTLHLLHMKAELRQLQYQINPHFLYNTYFTLRALMEEEEHEQATAFADLLGRYLKYTTNAEREYATLGEETNHAKNYAEIQQMRFSSRVQLQWGEFPERFVDLKVPKLILQPLIENTFEHGMKQKLNSGVIRVLFHVDEAIVIHVEDNGSSLTDEMLKELSARLCDNNYSAEHDSVALLNIHRRLRILFGDQSGLAVSRSELGGLKTTITIYGEMIDV